MSFLFNFPNPEDDSLSTEKTTEKETNDSSQLRPCEEIYTSDVAQSQDTVDIPTVSYQLSDDVCVRCLQSSAVEERLCSGPSTQYGAVQAAQSHSDLLPNVYEGGLKVWECAIDLAQYLCTSGITFQGKTVAELGCGAGVPGIVAMRQGASQVHFQDYNEEVIQHYTIPNVSMNTPEGYLCKCQYFTGDWDAFRHRLVKQNIRYDVILTAETIYRQENYTKLSQFFLHCLAPSGVVYLAAKSNYFGVGGGTQDFANYLGKQGLFNAEMCHTVGEGLPREIWKITVR